MKLKLVLAFLAALMLFGCSGRVGYQILQEVAYQECLKQSRHPVEECVAPPSYDTYKRELDQMGQ